MGRAQVVFKIVGLKRGVMDYRNNVFIARGVGWRAPFSRRGGIPGDYIDRHRKAAVVMAAEVGGCVLRCVALEEDDGGGWRGNNNKQEHQKMQGTDN